MGLKAGDVVRVVGKRSGAPLAVPTGTVAAVCNIWDDMEYPIELLGFSECVQVNEVVRVSSHQPDGRGVEYEPPTPILVKQKEVVKMVGLSYPTILKLEKEGKFPKRRTLSECRVAWLYTELVEWAKGLD